MGSAANTRHTDPEMGVISMAGPAPQDRKHGRTPTAGVDWREYDDVPFAGAPELPPPPGRKKSWHPMVEAWWKTTSALPHAVDWRPEDWQKVYELLFEKERYYTAKTPKEQTTAQLTEIRRREDALGIGIAARTALRIRYKQKVEPGASGAGPDGARAVLDTSPPSGGVIPLADRRAAITARRDADAAAATGEGQSESQTA